MCVSGFYTPTELLNRRNITSMVRFATFICTVFIVPFAVCSPSGNRFFKLRDDVVYTVETADNLSTCKDFDAELWSYDIHNCFVDRKYNDSGHDLNSIVDRILEHSRVCVQSSTKECRPDYPGFLRIIGKVIEQMKDYSRLYLEDINHGREKIKDLDCVESSLSEETYKTCFKSVFDISNSPEKLFERKVEKGITCTNKSNKLCSKAAKTSLNRIVRTILGVKQSEEENIEEEVTPTAPPKRWYENVYQALVNAWTAIRNFFG